MAKTQLLTLIISIIFLLVDFTISNDVNASAYSSSAAALVKFKSTISDPMGHLRSWRSSNPCSSPVWLGVICLPNGNVYGLRLESMNLSGRLNLDPLSALPWIGTLSFSNNNFTGPMPDLTRFKSIRSVYVSGNSLSGEIDDDAFDGMELLKKVVLSGNGFSGPIPTSLTRVNRLLELWMDRNEFVGKIPDFKQLELKVLNVSHNNLVGKIPDLLRKMDVTMFEGNRGLCGPPTKVPCESLSPSPSPSPSGAHCYKEYNKYNACL